MFWYKHDFNKGNYNAIKSAFSDIHWCAAFGGKGTLDCYKLLSDTISNLIERCVPKKKFKTKKHVCGLTGKLKRLLDVEIKSGHCTVLREKILIIRGIRNVEI